MFYHFSLGVVVVAAFCDLILAFDILKYILKPAAEELDS